jgi:hypothetical protein
LLVQRPFPISRPRDRDHIRTIALDLLGNLVGHRLAAEPLDQARQRSPPAFRRILNQTDDLQIERVARQHFTSFLRLMQTHQTHQTRLAI